MRRRAENRRQVIPFHSPLCNTTLNEWFDEHHGREKDARYAVGASMVGATLLQNGMRVSCLARFRSERHAP